MIFQFANFLLDGHMLKIFHDFPRHFFQFSWDHIQVLGGYHISQVPSKLALTGTGNWRSQRPRPMPKVRNCYVGICQIARVDHDHDATEHGGNIWSFVVSNSYFAPSGTGRFPKSSTINHLISVELSITNHPFWVPPMYAPPWVLCWLS